MHILRMASLWSLVVSLSLPGAALSAGWSRRYDALSEAQRTQVAPFPDGAFVAGGYDHQRSSLVVVNRNGVVLASRAMPGRIVFLTTTRSGDIYAGLETPEMQAAFAVSVVKMRHDLSVAWARRIEDRHGDVLGPRRGAGTRDGGVVVAAPYRYGSTLVKLSRAGNVEWTSRADLSGDDDGIHSIHQTADGGYLASGSGRVWPWLLRFSARGSLLWQRAYGPESGFLESAVETSDGSLLAAGNSGAYAVLMKTSASGEVVWCRKATEKGYGYSVVETSSGAVATLTTNSLAGEVSLAGITSTGRLRWQRLFVRPSMTADNANAMLAVSAGKVGFSVASSQSLSITSFDEAAGPTGCAVFAENAIPLQDAPAPRVQALHVETSAPALVSRAITLATSMLETGPAAEDCIAAARPPVLPLVEGRTYPFRSLPDDTKEKREYVELLLKGRFQELDVIADRLRRERPSPDPMRPNRALSSFYRAFTEEKLAPEETRLNRLLAWRAANPESLTAAVALANAWYSAGWAARGSGDGSSVTKTGSSAYSTMLEQAKDVLDALGVAGEADPQYWVIRISLAHELGLEDVRKVGLIALSMHEDPRHADAVARYLYPQWGGSPEAYMAFADQASRATSRAFGDGLYLWLVFGIKNYQSSDDWKQFPVDWARVRKAAEDLIRIRPDWRPTYHQYAFLAERYGDAESLRSLFQRPELEWYEDADRIWLSREQHERTRREHMPPPPPRVVRP